MQIISRNREYNGSQDQRAPSNPEVTYSSISSPGSFTEDNNRITNQGDVTSSHGSTRVAVVFPTLRRYFECYTCKVIQKIVVVLRNLKYLVNFKLQLINFP